MPKKRVLSRAQREEILRQLGKEPVAVKTNSEQTTNKSILNRKSGIVDHTIIIKNRYNVITELKRVVIAMTVIVVLLAGIITLNLKTIYLQKAGQALTQKIGF